MGIQYYVKICSPKNSAEHYELLMKFESRHGMDRGGVSVSPGQRGARTKECIFRNEVRNEGIRIGFRGGA